MWTQLFIEIKILLKTFRFLYRAMLNSNNKEYEKSIENLKKAITIAKEGLEYSQYPLGILYYQLGYTYNLMDEFDKAHEYLRKAHRILLDETGQFTIDLADNYKELAQSRSGVSDYESAIVYYKRAIDIYLEINSKNKHPLAYLYSNLGMTYRLVGNFEKSNENFQNAISIYGKDKKRKDVVLRLKADICLNNAQYSQALDYRKEVLNLRLNRFNPKSSQIVQCFASIGELYIKMGEEEKALENFEKVIQYRKEKNIMDYSLNYVYSGLSRTFKLKKEYDKAITYLKKSLSIAEENTNYTKEELIEFHTTIGDLYEMKNDLKNAILYYENAYKMLEKLPEKKRTLSSEIFYDLAFLYEKKKKLLKADLLFNKLIQLYDTDLWQDLPFLGKAHSVYGEVWLARKKTTMAIRHLEKAQNLYIKSVTQDNVRAIANTSMNYLNLARAYSLHKKKEKALDSLLAGLSAFLNFTTDEESDLNTPWDKYQDEYISRNKEFKTPRAIHSFLSNYRKLKINYVDSFFENLEILSLKKSQYKKLIQFFEKHSKKKPRHYNWCKERIRKLEEHLT